MPEWRKIFEAQDSDFGGGALMYKACVTVFWLLYSYWGVPCFSICSKRAIGTDRCNSHGQYGNLI